jgi:hypothetical protein
MSGSLVRVYASQGSDCGCQLLRACITARSDAKDQLNKIEPGPPLRAAPVVTATSSMPITSRSAQLPLVRLRVFVFLS